MVTITTIRSELVPAQYFPGGHAMQSYLVLAPLELV